MIIIDNKNSDPYLNHAIEEHLIDKLEDDCFMLWQNAPCILLGRNQNAYAEINMSYVKEHNIAVVRRITGGGAVFNDWGNFNFTFIAKNKDNVFADFKKFTEPIIAALKKLNIGAEFKGRNDLVIEGKKFSGNAQCRMRDKILHHGTLLFNVDIAALVSALTVSSLKLKSNAVASVRSRVTNISEHLSEKMSIDEFRLMILDEVRGSVKDAKNYELTKADLQASEIIAKNKYRLDSWNFGQKVNFSFAKEERFTGGLVQMQADIVKGIIKEIRFFGDFFNEKPISEIEEGLCGIPYQYDKIEEKLKEYNIDDYFKNIKREEIISLIIG